MAKAPDLFGVEGTTSTIRFGRLGDLLILLHPLANPSTEDWRALIEYQRRELPSLRRTLVYTAGGGPNAGQRSQATAIYRDNPHVTLLAVITPSPVARLIVTAFNLFVEHPIKPFAPEDIDEAFKYLQLSRSEQATIGEILQRHAEWLGLKTSLRFASSRLS